MEWQIRPSYRLSISPKQWHRESTLPRQLKGTGLAFSGASAAFARARRSTCVRLGAKLGFTPQAWATLIERGGDMVATQPAFASKSPR